MNVTKIQLGCRLGDFGSVERREEKQSAAGKSTWSLLRRRGHHSSHSPIQGADETDQHFYISIGELLTKTRHLTLDAIPNDGSDSCFGLVELRQIRGFVRAASIVAVATGAVHLK